MHGSSAASKSQDTAEKVFAKNGLGTELPSFSLDRKELGEGLALIKVLVKTGLVSSGKEAKRLINESGAKIDDKVVTDPKKIISTYSLKQPIKLSAGKKRHIIVHLVS